MAVPVVSSCRRGLVLSQTYQPLYARTASFKSNFLDRKHNTTLAVQPKKLMSLRPKLMEIVKHKLIHSTKILSLGYEGRIFSKNFSTTGCEKLLHSSRCSIYTTAGPIKGILFVFNQRVGFCSDRSFKTYSAEGEVLKFQYKVSIPLEKIKEVVERVDTESPTSKYLELMTADDFSFWFLGLPNYKKTLGFLVNMINQS